MRIVALSPTAIALVVAVVLSVAGCDSDSPTVSSDDLQARQFCEERARILCDRAFRCLNATERASLDLDYTDHQACLEDQLTTNRCDSTTADTICGPGQVLNTSIVDTCINDLLALSCSDVLRQNPPVCQQVCMAGPPVLDVADGDDVVDIGGDGIMDMPLDGVPGMGACRSGSDQQLHRDMNMQVLAVTCGVTCITEPQMEQPPCIQDCLEITGLSGGCATCYTDLVLCSTENCLADCINGNSPECQACRREYGCLQAFQSCAGPVP